MKKILLVSFLSLWLAVPLFLAAALEFDLETGGLFSGYNDVGIPGDTGTLFSLSEELETDPVPFVRLRVFYSFSSRHHLGLLYAPLSVTAEGSLDRALEFNGESFAATTPLETTYTFNSYRLIYRYDFLLREKLQMGIGFTAKIRDAEISVSDGNLKTSKTNVGFVPILHFRVAWNFQDNIGLLLDGDALAAPQGRAEDVLLALTYRISDRFGLKAGYRLLEGGADNDEVYTFSLFHYAVLGITAYF